MGKSAVIVVDMLNDFVTGSLKCERAQRIIPPLRKLLAAARETGAPVIYSNDSHLPEIDKELRIWGPHAMRGTPGAEVIPELAPEPRDYVIPKRRYSGFHGTDLEMLLRELGVDTVILTGLHCNMCVRHTAADAYFADLNIVVPSDGTEAFTESDYEGGMAYLRQVYAADIRGVDEIVSRLVSSPESVGAGAP